MTTARKILGPAQIMGPALMGIGLLGLGAQNLLLADFLMELQPVPRGLPGRVLWAYLTGALLVGGGFLLVLRWRPRMVAAGLALTALLAVALLHLPRLLMHLDQGSVWTPTFEIVALAGGLLVLAAGTSSERRLSAAWNARIDRATTVGRLMLAVSLPVFGVLHFIYHDYVASVVPGWIPAHQFWAYATGVAHIAAGLALLSGIQARLAAPLLGIMFGTWALILHIPRVAADAGNRQEWTSLFVAVALTGAAFTIAASLARVPARVPAALAARSGTA